VTSSLGQRILLGVVGIASAVVLVAAFGVHVISRQVLLDGVDRELVRRDELLQLLATAAESSGRPTVPADLLPCRSDGRNLLEIVTDDAARRVLARSPSLPAGVSLSSADSHPGGNHDRILPDGRRIRLRILKLPRMPVLIGHYVPAMASHQPVLVYLGIDPAQEERELATMAYALAALWLATTLLAWLGAWLVRPALLRPLAHLRDAIAGIGPRDLGGRVPETAAPTEVLAVVQRLNELLGKVEDAFLRERNTITGIAHELRTPISELRTILEFRLLATPPAMEQTVLDASLAIALRMQQLVDDLLLLTRLEAGSESLQREPADLAALAADACEAWDEQARRRGHRLSLDLPDHAGLATSPRHVRLLLGNLLGNAVTHAPEGSDITISVRATPGDLTVTIINPCAGSLDVASLGRAFYRGDAARPGNGHCGLGLALCRRLAVLLAGELDLTIDDGRFSARLALPTG